jgi:hypothetical protein
MYKTRKKEKKERRKLKKRKKRKNERKKDKKERKKERKERKKERKKDKKERKIRKKERKMKKTSITCHPTTLHNSPHIIPPQSPRKLESLNDFSAPIQIATKKIRHVHAIDVDESLTPHYPHLRFGGLARRSRVASAEFV